MKVLFVTPEYPPYHIGGGGIVVKNLVRVLSMLGCDITIASGYYPVKSFFDKVKCDYSNVKTVWLPLLPTPKVRFQLKTVMPPNIFSFFQLIKVLSEDYDVVHLHGFGHGLIDVAVLLCLLMNRRKYILTLHGFPRSPLESGGIIGFLYKAYLLTFGRVLFRMAEKVIVISHSIKAEAVSMGMESEKSIVIPNGIDVSSYSDISVSDNTRRKFGIDEDDSLVVAVGILHSRKGFQFLIRAMPPILRAYPKAKVAIVGMDGGYGKNLKKITEKLNVSDKVIFTGFLDSTSKKELMKLADAIVIPSLIEPFGLVALEAMTCSKLIVATEVDGLKEVLENEKTALLVKPGSVEELTDAIIRLVNDDELRLRLARNAEEEVGKYDWDVVGQMHFKLYSSLAKRSGSKSKLYMKKYIGDSE